MRFDPDDPALPALCDDLPLWSAPFGLALLDAVELRRGARVLDLGCGTGFPLVELAGRLGAESRLVGVDPWRQALRRARAKLDGWGLANAALLRGEAEALPFPDASFDVIVANNGLNNVRDVTAALRECRRVCRPGGQLVATMNLPETMRELYDALAEVLRDLGRAHELPNIGRQIASKRTPRPQTEAALRAAGFAVEAVGEDEFVMRFASGAALLRHPFLRLAFLEGWHGIVASDAVGPVFAALEERLDRRAARGPIQLSVPYACYVCRG